MSNTENSPQNLDDKSKVFASYLEKVLKKFDETGIQKYFRLRDDEFYKSLVKEKSNFTDKFSAMNECVDKFKIAVKELDDVCVKFTKSISEKGLFSLSSIYLKKISKCAKSFYRDLNRLEVAVEDKETCQRNFDKISKSSDDLFFAIDSAVNTDLKTLRRPAKIQDTNVRQLMHGIGSAVRSFNVVYNRYKDVCFEE